MTWQELREGDFVRVTDGEFFPSDLLCLLSSASDCKIQTATLDGERTLKTKTPVATQLFTSTGKMLPNTLSATLAVTNPNPRLDNFSGSLNVGEESCWVDSKNLLWRGSNLRNTDWVIGAVVYAGMNSKLLLSQGKPPFKVSKYDHLP